jgi:hypothetical protein
MVTTTVKLVDPDPVFPARSVALAESVVVPAPKLHADPVAFAHVLLATKERAS